jgi:hypothetical protein
MMTRTRIVVAAALVVALGACHGGSKSASPSTSSSTTSTSTTAPIVSTTTAASTTTPVASTTTVSSVPRCRSANLRITASAPDGAAGTEYFELQYRNAGTAACEMTGYPGVSFLDATGKQIGVPARRSGKSYTSVVDPVGGTVSSQVAAGNPSVRMCPAASTHTVRVYPPNETAPVNVTIAGGLSVCSAQNPPAFIEPVVATANG